MTKIVPITAILGVLTCWALPAQTSASKPKRINKAIELLEQGQPIYYTGGHGGFEEGKRMAQTWAGGRSTNRSSCNSVNTAARSGGVRACRGARRARGIPGAGGGPLRRR